MYPTPPSCPLDGHKRIPDEVYVCGCDCCAPGEVAALEAYKAQLEQELARVEERLAELRNTVAG